MKIGHPELAVPATVMLTRGRGAVDRLVCQLAELPAHQVFSRGVRSVCRDGGEWGRGVGAGPARLSRAIAKLLYSSDY